MCKKKRYKSKQDSLNCLLMVNCSFGVGLIQEVPLHHTMHGLANRSQKIAFALKGANII